MSNTKKKARPKKIGKALFIKRAEGFVKELAELVNKYGIKDSCIYREQLSLYFDNWYDKTLVIDSISYRNYDKDGEPVGPTDITYYLANTHHTCPKNKKRKKKN